jgi:TonB family protein
MNSKKLLLGLLILSIGLAAYGFVKQKPHEADVEGVNDKVAPQESYYYVSARNKKSASPSTLKNATSIAELIEYYPSSWITGYDSVVVHTTSNGRQYSARSKDAELTAKQKELLSTADMFTDVVVYVKHKTTNSITKEVEDADVTYKIYVRPETEAKFPEGMEGLQKYLKENSEAEVAKLDTEMGFLAIVYFTINENGRAEDVEISESTKYKGVDDILLKVIKDMPSWSSAKDIDGKKVKQKFEFVFGFGNKDGGC